MNIIKILFILNIYLLIFSSNALAASTSVTPSFDSAEYYQGQSGVVDVWITNSGQDYILVESVWLTFDWMGERGYELDKTSTPIRINAGSKVNIGKISFGIESSSSIGYHTYQWLITGQENGLNFWGNPELSPFNTDWFGSTQISVETPLKPEAEAALNTARNDINGAQSKNFESVDAMNKVNKAVTDYNSGISAQNGRDFSSAINYANSAKKLIADSYTLEQTYMAEKEAERAKKEAEKIALEKQDKAKQDAINIIATTKSKIDNIIDLKSEQATNMLNDARSHLNSAENHLSTGDFDAAINEAKIAGDYADNALTTDETWISEHPLQSAAKAPGFGYLYTILGMILVFVISSKK